MSDEPVFHLRSYGDVSREQLDQLTAPKVRYVPPPHMDEVALISRGIAQLRAWHEVYGKHNPTWLPPAGDVRWLEDATAFLVAHTLPQPTATGRDGNG